MKEWSTLKKSLVIGTVGLFGIAGINGSTQNNNTKTPTPTTGVVQGTSTVQTPVKTIPVETTPTVTNSSNLSNNNTYTNVDGNTVHSPAYSEDGTVPAGATAQCADGTYSFSLHRQGTCSHHGGVSTWL